MPHSRHGKAGSAPAPCRRRGCHFLSCQQCSRIQHACPHAASIYARKRPRFCGARAKRRDGQLHLCDYASRDRLFMGCCGIHPYKHGEGLEIGYWLGEPYWGHGFATEAAHALIDLAFRATGIGRLHVSCRASNGGSRRVIHKCGFQFSGMGMADSLAAGNVPVEHYVLDRRTWIGLRSWQS
ncbi:conserved hypothetical protein [Brucella melitensis bv. 3 str. Ether]|nr:conserved hypothetical protein [Brucella melitensis bv. 1 str. 16M]EEZ12617.1 conserved hypothetical protein [Brucella melitensis bv. 3 str. Ether]